MKFLFILLSFFYAFYSLKYFGFIASGIIIVFLFFVIFNMFGGKKR